MRVYDRQAYPLTCVLRGHRWYRAPYSHYVYGWKRDRSCKRCAHILEGVAAVDKRFRQANEAARAEGCPCGAPATHVRQGFGAMGAVGPEFWTCAAHVNVNRWSGTGDGVWTPAGDFGPAEAQWVGSAQEF